jgi:hypothetical protein
MISLIIIVINISLTLIHLLIKRLVIHLDFQVFGVIFFQNIPGHNQQRAQTRLPLLGVGGGWGFD